MMFFNRNRTQVFTSKCGLSAMSASPRSSSATFLVIAQLRQVDSTISTHCSIQGVLCHPRPSISLFSISNIAILKYSRAVYSVVLVNDVCVSISSISDSLIIGLGSSVGQFQIFELE